MQTFFRRKSSIIIEIEKQAANMYLSHSCSCNVGGAFLAVLENQRSKQCFALLILWSFDWDLDYILCFSAVCTYFQNLNCKALRGGRFRIRVQAARRIVC